MLPLLRRPFSATALVAWALAPDLPYFARSTPVQVSTQSWYEPYMNATTSHTLLGALTVSLPYAVALWGLFLVARRPVGSLLLAPVSPRPPEPDGASALLRRAGWVLLSLLIGIAAVGAVANTLEWWSGGSGLAARDLVEVVLSDVATGAGAALIAALLLYVVCWWAVRAVAGVRRPR